MGLGGALDGVSVLTTLGGNCSTTTVGGGVGEGYLTLGMEALLDVAFAVLTSISVVFCSAGVARTSDTFADGVDPRLTGATTVIPSGGDPSPGSEGSVMTTYVSLHLAYLGETGDLGEVAPDLDSTGRVMLRDRAFGGSLVLGSVAALGTAYGGFTLSPGLWLKTKPAGIDTGLGGMGGGGLAV